MKAALLIPAPLAAALAARRPTAPVLLASAAHLRPLPPPRTELPPPLPRSVAPRNDKEALQGLNVRANQNEQAKHSAKSTASEAQRQRALAMLAAGPKNTIELRAAGIFQTSTRIKELREQGHSIFTERITAVDADGYSHNGIARYWIASKPEAAQ